MNAKHFARVLFTIILIFLVISYTDTNQLQETVSKIKLPYYITAYIISLTGTLLVQSLITHKIIKVLHSTVSLSKLVAINFRMNMYAVALPTGITTGILWHNIAQLGLGKKKAVLVLAIDKSLHILFLALITFLSLLTDSTVYNEIRIPILSVSGLIVCIGVISLIDSPIRRSKIYLPLKKFSHYLFKQKIDVNRSIVGQILLYSFIGQILVTLSQQLILLSIGVYIPILSLLWINSTISLILLLPITVAGIGTRELGWITLLNIFGVPSPQALTLSLILFSFRLISSAVGLILIITTIKPSNKIS